MSTTASETPGVALIGAGIMSATLGTLLKELEPTLDVVMFETLDDCAQESSEAWNNAGTGHAANCELNYTPQRSDGTVDISKALEVNTEFDISRQLWSHLVTKGAIPDPRSPPPAPRGTSSSTRCARSLSTTSCTPPASSATPARSYGHSASKAPSSTRLGSRITSAAR